MFENPRRGRQARNFTTNVSKILDLRSSSEQIFFPKLSLGAPDYACKNAEMNLKSTTTNGFNFLACKQAPCFHLACENIRFSSLFAAGDVSSPATKSEEKRMFSQASFHPFPKQRACSQAINFRIINSLMGAWGVRLTWLDCNIDSHLLRRS